ncbi:hydantoinase/oxoprolinase family protein [Rhodococcus sp. NPDC058521]|uniref:hydantoinase/oxoprolinase family protein n=1 Tax=Rhodococcus sp. NPDC058521 TaxID=3346536 RepID=UPI00366321B1
MDATMYLISTDTGGTFVDTAIVDADGELFVGKAPSTPHEPAKGLLESIDAAAGRFGESVSGVLSKCRLFVNGTTVTTNALIQRKGTKTGFITTAGFEDTLLIGRVRSRTAGLDAMEITDYRHAERPDPIVPRDLIRGVTERVNYQGEVIASLDVEHATRVVDELAAEGIEGLAICLLWSFRNSVHEQELKKLVAVRHPHIYVTTSSDLVPVIGEYERANTTAINSFLGPTLQNYVRGVEDVVSSTGYGREILIMQSIGGLSPASELAERSVTSLHSGPVGGIVAAQKLGEQLGEPNIITADMGGTSFDVGLIVDGAPQTASQTIVERNILRVPAVEAVSIGAGGGSVAWLDEVGAIRLGPQSQGSYPGPACYGRGGTLATVTDADVVLGYISADYFLGGAMKLDREKAIEVVNENIAKPLGISVEEAAFGIYRIANSHMGDLVRQMTIERGYDPRTFTLVNFGGCGPTHCTGYGPEVDVKSSVIPSAATVFSAFGIGQSDIRHFSSRSLRPMTIIRQGEPVDSSVAEEVNEIVLSLSDDMREQLQRDGVPGDDGTFEIHMELRYKGQTNELTIPVLADLPIDQAHFDEIVANFERQYEMLYGKGARSTLSALELITIRVDATVTPPGSASTISRPRYQESGDPLVGEREVYWPDRGYTPTPVYRGELLTSDQPVIGPAVIDTYGTTIPLHPGQILEVDETGNYYVRH